MLVVAMTDYDPTRHDLDFKHTSQLPLCSCSIRRSRPPDLGQPSLWAAAEGEFARQPGVSLSKDCALASAQEMKAG